MTRTNLGLWAALLFSLSAHAQLSSVDGGLVVEDSNGLMYANTIGTNLSWLPGTGPETTAQWVAGLNAEDYGGYNDWTVATADGNDAPNTTTNQLGELFQSDCGNAAGGPISLSNAGKGCTSFTSLVSALQTSPYFGKGDQLFFSSSNYYGTCCNIYTTYWWAYGITPAYSFQAGWDYDTAFEGGLERADAIAVRGAPEIDVASAAGALALLIGSLVLFADRRRLEKSGGIG
jgi:hypothetical protein